MPTVPGDWMTSLITEAGNEELFLPQRPEGPLTREELRNYGRFLLMDDAYARRLHRPGRGTYEKDEPGGVIPPPLRKFESPKLRPFRINDEGGEGDWLTKEVNNTDTPTPADKFYSDMGSGQFYSSPELDAVNKRAGQTIQKIEELVQEGDPDTIDELTRFSRERGQRLLKSLQEERKRTYTEKRLPNGQVLKFNEPLTAKQEKEYLDKHSFTPEKFRQDFAHDLWYYLRDQMVRAEMENENLPPKTREAYEAIEGFDMGRNERLFQPNFRRLLDRIKERGK